MKTHDIIYMPNELLSEDWQRHIEGQDTAYMRMDKLVEILDEEKEETAIGISEYDKGEENGRMEVIASILQKIKTP